MTLSGCQKAMFLSVIAACSLPALLRNKRNASGRFTVASTDEKKIQEVYIVDQKTFLGREPFILTDNWR